jgi:hypothetical protein
MQARAQEIRQPQGADRPRVPAAVGLQRIVLVVADTNSPSLSDTAAEASQKPA